MGRYLLETPTEKRVVHTRRIIAPANDGTRPVERWQARDRTKGVAVAANTEREAYSALLTLVNLEVSRD